MNATNQLAPPPVRKEAAINRVNDGLERKLAQLYDHICRLTNMIDEASGPVPQNPGAEDVPMAGSKFDQTFAHLEAFGYQLSRLEDQLARLEEII